ncbi:MAG: hypothetical protein WA161_17935 [Pseudomonas sp.]|uniref:hypothetical protein n=1 Tax=Pseudomonas sp. TaxID=306 RepID=UPI003BB513DC
MNTKNKSILECAERLSAASDVMEMLSGLFTAIGKLDQANAHAVARAGRYIAEDWANTLDADAEQLRIEAARMAGEVRQ